VILAIDTSTDQASVSLSRDNHPVSEISWQAAGNHSRHIFPVITHLMSVSGVDAKDFSAIAAAIGPGSFNGIRVGLSFAKGVALALRVPLVGIGTLDIIAYQAAGARKPVWATVPAGREEVCCARFQLIGAGLERQTAYLRLDAGDAADLVRPGDVICGPGRTILADASRHLLQDVCLYPAVRDLKRASFLAELARQYLDAGGETQIDDVEPLYLRRPAAEERRAAAAQE
jgi:tRNA threonylcarbamoyl adenosine modification protein YeaZ